MKLKFDKKGKVKLAVAGICLLFLLAFVPLIISQNQTNETENTNINDSNISEIIEPVLFENITEGLNQSANESTENETKEIIVEEIESEEEILQETPEENQPLSGGINMTDIFSNRDLIPEGDPTISIRINNDLCVTINRPNANSDNVYATTGCVTGVHYEDLQTLIDQMEGNE